MTSLDFSTHSQLRLRPSVQRQIRICSSSGFPKVIRKNTTIRALLSAEIIGFRVPAKCGEMLHIFYSHLFKCKWGRLKNKRMNTLIKKKLLDHQVFCFKPKKQKKKNQHVMKSWYGVTLFVSEPSNHNLCCDGNIISPAYSTQRQQSALINVWTGSGE